MTTPKKPTKAVVQMPADDMPVRAVDVGRIQERDAMTGHLLEPSAVMPATPALAFKPVTPAVELTPGDERRLLNFARSRAKVGKAHIDAACAELLADVEKKLSEEFCYEDEMWAEATKLAQQAVRAANEQIAKVADERGVPAKFRPRIHNYWAGRGENADRGRRDELRTLAKARVKAIGQQTKAEIDIRLAEIEADIYAGGLSDRGIEFLTNIEDPRTLMQEITVTELDDAYYAASPYRHRPEEEDNDDDDE